MLGQSETLRAPILFLPCRDPGVALPKMTQGYGARRVDVISTACDGFQQFTLTPLPLHRPLCQTTRAPAMRRPSKNGQGPCSQKSQKRFVLPHSRRKVPGGSCSCFAYPWGFSIGNVPSLMVQAPMSCSQASLYGRGCYLLELCKGCRIARWILPGVRVHASVDEKTVKL